MHKLTIEDVTELAGRCAKELATAFPESSSLHLVGIPRGGLVAALAIAEALPRVRAGWCACVHSSTDGPLGPEHSPLVLVDDIVATGQTLERAAAVQLHVPAAAVLVSKVFEGGTSPYSLPLGLLLVRGARFSSSSWVQFPWETADPDAGAPEDAVRRLIEYVGDDPAREGLVDTPRRVLAYLDEVREGGKVEVEARTFASASDDLLVVSGIALSSLCEHHMLPYQGTAAVAYIPKERLLGLSKIARLVQQAASGLTVQEDLTRSIAERVIEASGSPDVAVVTEAAHSCMIARGVRAVGSETLASAMLGRFREEDALRAEALALLVRR